MYLEDQSGGYMLTELDVVGWPNGYAAIQSEQHDMVSEEIYDEPGHVLVMRENKTGHMAVYPEGSMPTDTLAIPDACEPDEYHDAHVMVAKEDVAGMLFGMYTY